MGAITDFLIVVVSSNSFVLNLVRPLVLRTQVVAEGRARGLAPKLPIAP